MIAACVDRSTATGTSHPHSPIASSPAAAGLFFAYARLQDLAWRSNRQNADARAKSMLTGVDTSSHRIMRAEVAVTLDVENQPLPMTPGYTR